VVVRRAHVGDGLMTNGRARSCQMVGIRRCQRHRSSRQKFNNHGDVFHCASRNCASFVLYPFLIPHSLHRPPLLRANMQRPNYGNPPPAHSPPCTYRDVFIRSSREGCVLTRFSAPPSPATRFHRSPAAITTSPATPFTTPKRLWLRTASWRHAAPAGRIRRAPVIWRLHQRPHCPSGVPNGKERRRRRAALHGTECTHQHSLAPYALLQR
jgi:hypothetical protein